MRSARGLLSPFSLIISLMLASATTASAQTFKTLVNLGGPNEDQSGFSLVQATDGNLYGVTESGRYDSGSVFRISPAGGSFVTIHSFCSEADCPDGKDPYVLIQGTDAYLYGTTQGGGTYSSGTVFKIALSGKLTTIYSFCPMSGCADGSEPGQLVEGADGNFYGITLGGGNGGCGNLSGCGTVFRVTLSGVLTTLYNFCSQPGCTDGVEPLYANAGGGVIQATDGNFYGTTYSGGANGYGTVFRVSPAGAFTTLHSFGSLPDYADGVFPYGLLVQGSDGNFYGTTYGGTGDPNTYGTVFKMSPSGTLTTLYSFCSQDVQGICTDGENPVAGLVQGTDGNFYGTTLTGGAHEYDGTIFNITPSGTLTTLHSFDGSDGFQPYASLMQATNGTFYGTTALGGASGDGTIFSLSNGLGSFVETVQASDKVGAKITILGTSLTGTTAVSFNGTPATFTVEKSSEIKAAVPEGATTGALTVTTPGGTLTSNATFRVTPQVKAFKPVKGPVGTEVQITGVSLTQTSTVSVGGVAASFTINSDSSLTARVSTGAVTGPITITTSGGAVTTKTEFTVTE